MVSAVSTKIGSNVDVLYPSRGYRNILRRVRGELLEKGKGPNGPFITVQEGSGKIRSLSLSKIVNRLR